MKKKKLEHCFLSIPNKEIVNETNLEDNYIAIYIYNLLYMHVNFL